MGLQGVNPGPAGIPFSFPTAAKYCTPLPTILNCDDDSETLRIMIVMFEDGISHMKSPVLVPIGAKHR